MRKCEKCGVTQYNNNQTNCPVCGEKMVEVAQIPVQPAPTEPLPEIVPASAHRPASESRGGVWKSILSTILIVAVSTGVRFCIKNSGDKGRINDVEEFIQEVEKYQPGELSAEGYSSEYWDLRFTADDNWVMMDESELNEMSTSAEASMSASVNTELDKMDISDELRDKVEESLYTNTEMGCFYFEDDEYIGFNMMLVCSMYGMSDADVEDFVDGVKQGGEGQFQNMSSGTEMIAGQKYHYVEGTVSSEGEDIVMRMTVRKKGAMMAIFYTYYLPGNESMATEFINHITTY